MKFFIKVFKKLMPLMLISSILCGLIYVAVQQDYRQSANDPQIQMAEDAATKLSQAQKIQISDTVDIAQSLSPFLIIFDKYGEISYTNAVINHNSVRLPQGVLIYANEHGENRITWSPRSGVRIAAVVVHFTGNSEGYVLAGRNIREVESRESKLLLSVTTAWIISLILSFIFVVVAEAK